MIFQGLGADQVVVDVNSSEQEHVLEYTVHGLLKCRSGTEQSEGHIIVRKSSVLGPERCAFDVFGKYQNLMKS